MGKGEWEMRNGEMGDGKGGMGDGKKGIGDGEGGIGDGKGGMGDGKGGMGDGKGELEINEVGWKDEKKRAPTACRKGDYCMAGKTFNKNVTLT